MSDPKLLKPDLYAAIGTAALPGRPSLLGGECTCGHVFFPMQHYGCEQCGRFGDALSTRALSGSGRILALARVHLHMGKDRQAPFTIASIALDDGPVVRTLLEPGRESDASAGARVWTTLTQTSLVDGTPVVDLRFTLHQ